MATELFICTNLAPGMLVRLERIHRGLRQADLAQLAGVTQAEVSALERGRQVIPGVRRRVYQALELDIAERQED
jgi:transcriptional regulator with XRE-family HTH domain